MGKIKWIAAVMILICVTGGCSRENQGSVSESQATDTAATSVASDEPVKLAGVDWNTGLLAKTPEYTGGGVLEDSIQTENMGSVDILKVPLKDVIRYTEQLKDDGYMGSLTAVEGAELQSGSFRKDTEGVIVNLVFTGKDSGKLSLTVTRLAVTDTAAE